MAKRQTESVPLSKFGILVAQLESIVASASQQHPEPLLCFDLLSALVAAIEEESQEIIVQWQRKCEDALFSLLVLGARRPIRRLASLAMVRVIGKGDGISIYSEQAKYARASSLQGWFADCKRSEPLSSAGLAQCLGELYRCFGRKITSGLTETVNIAAKLLKFHEDFVRQDALQMLECALEGSGSGGVSAAYSESFRIIMRLGVSDKAFIVRLAAARCLKTFASIGGPGLSTTELENSMLHCLKALEDTISSLRDAFAEALGALLALALNLVAQVNKKGNDYPVPAKKLEDSLQKYMILPFIKATGVRAKDLRIGLTLSWVFFLQLIHLKYHISDEELQNYAARAIDMLQENASADAQATACVLYILRVGATDQMTEAAQKSFLVHLARKLKSADFCQSAGVAIFRILSYLLTALGEVPGEFKDIIDDTVVAALSHSSVHVRIEAALTLRALAEVDPTSVGGLISYGVTTLYALRESAANRKGNQLNHELFSLHGQAAFIAALISISPKLPLGYPSRTPKSVLEVAKKMLAEFSWNPSAATVEMEAGWFLLASLVASMPKELEDQVFDVLLLWADPFVGGSDSRSRRSQDLMSDLRVLSAAIEALDAFIKSFVSPTTTSFSDGILLQPVLAYLGGALYHLSFLTAKHLPNLRPAIDLFTIRILMTYQSVSDPMSYKSEHPQILQICSTPFSEPSVCEESSCLKFLLDKRDACLGPWIPGRDSFEDELRSFDGSKDDGLMPCVWEGQLASFPQPYSISQLLVNQRLLCFGVIFSCQDDGGKALLLSKIDNCLKTGKKQFWYLTSIINACVALLAALKAMLGARVQRCGPDILSAFQSIFLGILAEGEITSAQRRASAEGLGLLARLGGDIFTARMTKSLLGELVSTTDSNYSCSIALSLGCIHRSVGGMALSSLVPATVSSVSSLAKSSNVTLQLWSLHALLLIIEAAGLSFVPQVQATLFLVMEILLGEENGFVELRQEIGRIVNAIVAVLGPELVPGSTFFSRCKSVIAEISACPEISTLFESVRFTQQLVLFAPQAVSIHNHVQSLLPTLSSRQPSLRHLAVSTLRHLIEKYPSMVNEKIEEDLFRMLDEETDSEIVILVRSTITRLLYASCPTCPSRWLSILHKMVLSVSTKNNAENGANNEKELMNGASEGEIKMHFGDVNEDMIASSSGESIQNSINKRDKHLRYRTRLFAAECLSHLPEAVGANPAHFDLFLARNQRHSGSSSNDWLVLHLQELISLSYQISTGPFVWMQSIGVELLTTVMEKFGKTQDPELPGHLLLEQYQAQLVSAVRSAISTSSSPLLLEAGLQLATKLLTGSILSGDRVAVSRMFSLISKPLNEIKDLCYPSFAEWVASKIKVRLLAAHASIKSFVYQFFRKEDNIPDEYLQLASLLSSSSSILGQYWISILRDYVFISFGLNLKSSFKPFLDGIQSPMVSSKMRVCIDEAWPLILEATSLDAIPVRLEADQASKTNSIINFQKSSFISGYGMVRLEPRDFDFLWGLSLMVLFHGKEPLLSTKEKTLFCYTKNKYDGDSVLEETHDLASGEIALLVFQSLSQERFFRPKFITLDSCKELLQILVYAEHTSSSWNSLVAGLLSQVVLFCPDVYFEMEDFTAAAMELFFKCLSTFHGCNMVSKDEASFTRFFPQLFSTAEGLVKRMNNKKNQERMITALISTACEWFRRASTKLCLYKVLAFLHNLVTFLKSYIKDEAGRDMEDQTHVRAVFLTWASLLASLSQDCTKRIHIIDHQLDELGKLLSKMLFLCLEEAIVFAKLVYETQIFRTNEGGDQLRLFSVFRLFTRCIQDALCDRNRQVQSIGLNLLKFVVQRELAEPSNIKSNHFFLFISGEVVGDIFILIQHELKESVSKKSISVIEECLRLLFLFHTLAQRTEQPQEVLKLLLEALLMVFYISNETSSQGYQDVNAIARILFGHLIHIPSSATHLKDVMLSMPGYRRQQLQDMLRASVAQDQTIPNKINMQSDIKPREDNQLHESDVMASRTLNHEQDADGDKNGDDDDDDEWDAFQSLPSQNTAARTLDSHDEKGDSETATAIDPSVIENEGLAVEDVRDTLNTERNASEEEMKLGTNYLIDAADSKNPEGGESINNNGDNRSRESSYHHSESDEASNEMFDARSSLEGTADEMMGTETEAEGSVRTCILHEEVSI
ncbi:LOW QUALITY PROTEIN: HEAT repeat-containing protein 5B [Phalaenopsis equestris]|uniref:LOW QUALITY PROTEIN: HEAT repeat-containing protein 5B n=1 Tax=Phalaenopsis equestris TaxID=78828 RepID=UPI0009E5E6B0|nr:LOW QUALITY PROTEIN: HEAT repeat-containing protein 5B [Phalaenopsis equestris]